MANWYFARAGQQHGPYDDGQMRQMLAGGQVTPQDLIWRDGMPNWLPAGQVQEIAASIPRMAPAPMGAPQPISYATPGAYAPPPNHLVGAILITLFCCLPLGIVSIVYAAQVNGKAQSGDIQGALASSANAKKFLWMGFWIGIVANLLVVGIQVMAAVAQSR